MRDRHSRTLLRCVDPDEPVAGGLFAVHFSSIADLCLFSTANLITSTVFDTMLVVTSRLLFSYTITSSSAFRYTKLLNTRKSIFICHIDSQLLRTIARINTRLSQSLFVQHLDSRIFRTAARINSKLPSVLTIGLGIYSRTANLFHHNSPAITFTAKCH